MELNTKLLAQIAVALDAMQLQLNYNRALLISSLGGEPVIPVASGNVLVGTTTDITDAKLQVAGSIVSSNGSGGTCDIISTTHNAKFHSGYLTIASKAEIPVYGASITTSSWTNAITLGNLDAWRSLIFVVTLATGAGTLGASSFRAVYGLATSGSTPTLTLVTNDITNAYIQLVASGSSPFAVTVQYKSNGTNSLSLWGIIEAYGLPNDFTIS